MKKYILMSLIALAPMAGHAQSAGASTKNIDEMFKNCDTNSDGSISKDEFTQEKLQHFSKYDQDGNGMLSKAEHDKMANDTHMKLMGQKSVGSEGRSKM